MSKVEVMKRPIERLGDDIKKSAWSAVIESLATLILGILFIAWPEAMVKIISYVVGVFFVIKGIFQTINYFIVGGPTDFFNNGLLMGVISVLIGVAALAIGEDIANIFRIVVGVWMIYESIVRINTSIKLSSVGLSAWRYVLLLALVMLVLGIFVTFNNVTTVIGWMMIVAGVVGLVGDIIFIQHINILVDKLVGRK